MAQTNRLSTNRNNNSSNPNSNRNSKLDKRSFSQLANDIAHAPDEYEFFKENDDFATSFVEEFVNNLLEAEFIPDILMEVTSELTDKSKIDIFQHEYTSGPLQSDIYIRNTSGDLSKSKYANQLKYDGSELLSDNILNSLRMTNQYSVGNASKPIQSYSYNTKPIDFYYKPSPVDSGNRLQVKSSDFYSNNLNDNTLITDLDSNDYLIFDKPEQFTRVTSQQNRSIFNPKSKTMQQQNNNNNNNNYKRFGVQGKASSANFLLHDSSHLFKKPTRQIIKAEVAASSNPIISSMQNTVTEEFIGTTLKSDILRTLVNETLNEERRKQNAERALLFANDADDINLEYVRNLLYKKSDNYLPNRTTRKFSPNIDFEQEYYYSLNKTPNSRMYLTDSQDENTFGLFSNSVTNTSRNTADIFNLDFLNQ